MYYEEKIIDGVIMTDAEKLSRAIRYLADSYACTRVQFNRDPLRCYRHSEGTDGCEDCWREELGGEECTTDI